MSSSQPRKRMSLHKLPILPALVALVLAVGALYATSVQKTTPDGISGDIRPVNTVTTDDAECTWGLDINGYASGSTYSGTFTIQATGNPVTSWIATFTLPGAITGFGPGSVSAGSTSGSGTGGPTTWTYAWTGSGGPALGSSASLSIPAFGTYRALTCTATLTTTATDIHVATTGSDVPTCGAPASPCATINYGQTRAVGVGSSKVMVQNGTYPGGFTLQSGVNVIGGYSTSWVKGGNTGTIVNGGATASVNGTVQNMTINGPGGTNTTGVLVAGGSPLLKDNIINSGTPSGAGSSAYGVRVTSGSVTIVGGEIHAANGVDGTNASSVAPPTPTGATGAP